MCYSGCVNILVLPSVFLSVQYTRISILEVCVFYCNKDPHVQHNFMLFIALREGQRYTNYVQEGIHTILDIKVWKSMWIAH